MAYRKTRIGIVAAVLTATAFAFAAPAAWGELVSPGEVTNTTATQAGGETSTDANLPTGDDIATTPSESSDDICVADLSPAEPDLGLALAAYTVPVDAARKADEPQLSCNSDKSRFGVDVDDMNKKLIITVKPRPNDGKCVIVNTKVIVSENLGGGKVQISNVEPKVDKNGQLESIEVPFGQNEILVVISFELKCGNATVKPRPISFQYAPRTGRVTAIPAK